CFRPSCRVRSCRVAWLAVLEVEFDSELPELGFELRRRLIMNDVHSEIARGHDVLLAVVDEHRRLRMRLSDTQRALVKSGSRLAETKPARRKKRVEDRVE